MKVGRGTVLTLLGSAIVASAIFLGSPFWSMAGLARAVCAEDDAVLEVYIDRSRMNRLEVWALKRLGRRACPTDRPGPSESNTFRTALNVYRRTQVQWITSRTIKVNLADEAGGELASAILEREGLHWRMVDIGIGR